MNVLTIFSRRRAWIVLLLAAFCVLLAALFLTGGGDSSLEYNAPASLSNTQGLVDQQPLQTARRLASEVATESEQQQAEQALRLADNAVDQAFATALREATTHATPLKGEALAISQQIGVQEKQIQAEKDHLAGLTAAQPRAADPDDAAQQIELAQAQLDLDTDKLNDLHQDLIRLGGDRHAKIQQALDEHEAVQKQAGSTPKDTSNARLESPENLRSLAGKFRALFSLNQRDRQLKQARADALNAAGRLTAQHEQLEMEAESASGSRDGQSTTDAIQTLRELSGQRRTMIEYDTRVHDHQQLAETYLSWDQLVQAQRRTVLHRIFRALAIITALLLVALGATTLIRGFFRKRIRDHRRLSHVRLIAELAVQVVAFGIVLVIIFGPPKEMPAIIGLATAGATIVMKDFIVAFFGWFPLMGKNGIRVGDWVEINGVSGEVVEIGMLRTVLLETGNWADSGHPTGRRVTFMNSFAIEGRYFNFSTSGQWLWDELHVTVARGEDAYNKIDAIRQMVADYTSQDAALAEQEWRKATSDYVLKGFSAAPAVDLRPTVDAIEVTVRYITRAQVRHQVRSDLYRDVIQVLHFEGEAQTAAIGS